MCADDRAKQGRRLGAEERQEVNANKFIVACQQLWRAAATNGRMLKEEGSFELWGGAAIARGSWRLGGSSPPASCVPPPLRPLCEGRSPLEFGVVRGRAGDGRHGGGGGGQRVWRGGVPLTSTSTAGTASPRLSERSRSGKRLKLGSTVSYLHYNCRVRCPLVQNRVRRCGAKFQTPAKRQHRAGFAWLLRSCVLLERYGLALPFVNCPRVNSRLVPVSAAQQTAFQLLARQVRVRVPAGQRIQAPRL